MEAIMNYLDIPSEERNRVLDYFISAFAPPMERKTLKRELEKSQEGKLPQYIFVFRDNELIGYSIR